MTSTSTFIKRKQDLDSLLVVQRKKQKHDSDRDTTNALHVHVPLTLSELQQSLDFSSPSLNTASSIISRFDIIGQALLNDFHLVLRNEHSDSEEETVFEILELEFYLRKEGCHEDPFTHGSEEQKVSGTWYFHRSPRRSTDPTQNLTSLTGYRGGSRKGLDLTFGGPNAPSGPSASASTIVSSPYFAGPQPATSASPSSTAVHNETRTRGGALLRSVRCVSGPGLGLGSGGDSNNNKLKSKGKGTTTSKSKVVSGPSLLVDEILRLSDASSIKELVQQKWGDDTFAFLPRGPGGSLPPDRRSTWLFLRPRSPRASLGSLESTTPTTTTTTPPTPTPTIYRTPRIGLDLGSGSSGSGSPSTTHPRAVFLSRPYRYLTHPELLTAKGRPQTFVGVLWFLLDRDLGSGSGSDSDWGVGEDITRQRQQRLQSPALLRDLADVTGLGETTAVRYLDSYRAGFQVESKSQLGDFVGARGSKLSPGMYLEMVGTLARVQAGTDG